MCLYKIAHRKREAGIAFRWLIAHSRLRLRLQSAWLWAWFGANNAGGGDGRATHRFVIVACIPQRETSLHQVHDLFAGQRLIFEKTLGERFKILTLLGNDFRCFGETRLHQPPHFLVDLLRGGLGR